MSGVHAVRPLRWHDAGVEVIQLFVPGLHQVLPETRHDRAGRGVLWVWTSNAVHGEMVSKTSASLCVYVWYLCLIYLSTMIEGRGVGYSRDRVNRSS